MECNAGAIYLHHKAKAVLLRRMSLNRCEQMVLDYVSGHQDERQFWMDKVRSVSRSVPDNHEAARLLESDIWSYYIERSEVVEPFRSDVRFHGTQRTSMRNLADYWCRLWGVVREPKARSRTYDGY